MGYVSKEDGKGLLRAQHPGGQEADGADVILELFQCLPAWLRQGQVRAAAVAVLQVGLSIAVTNQVESAHFSRCSNPQ